MSTISIVGAGNGLVATACRTRGNAGALAVGLQQAGADAVRAEIEGFLCRDMDDSAAVCAAPDAAHRDGRAA
ncbi:MULTISPECIES: hypothetical protein [Micrococcaceae]|jgi:ketol-acid reductoisomerase|uniref:Oxidoreductase n=3 Tax=Micrococcaceae TaxID=1268 RepID=Q6SK63_PAEAU|nr:MULTISPECIES: hypothetical protein [Micrococcaceae]AAS20109.1 oxidoreductase [Paenarthrobacter aurescens]ABM10555.1 hypothetical protein AAur_pTC10153 [Paenarthrobacter aurescens TC1]SDQ03339.1 hypothetical protein SAMN04489742_0069 [Arthrobacter crystallopoietes]